MSIKLNVKSTVYSIGTVINNQASFANDFVNGKINPSSTESFDYTTLVYLIGYENHTPIFEKITDITQSYNVAGIVAIPSILLNIDRASGYDFIPVCYRGQEIVVKGTGATPVANTSVEYVPATNEYRTLQTVDAKRAGVFLGLTGDNNWIIKVDIQK